VVRSRFSSLENQQAEEQESRRRADMIIARPTQANAALVARMPELEAAESYEDGSEGAAGGQGVPIHAPHALHRRTSQLREAVVEEVVRWVT
jgi:hypothetical protein